MSSQTVIPAIGQASFCNIQLVATDVDGTLTTASELTPQVLQALAQLHQQGIAVMLVTGRSVGWVSALVNYLPVVGAIAENGGLYLPKASLEPVILPDIPRMSSHRERLSALFERIRKYYPQLQPSADNAYRITDWTFDIGELRQAEISGIQKLCAEQSMGFTYSTVQCHLKVPRQNKADGLLSVLSQYFPQMTPQAILTIGDSPNDESLFNPQIFPHSVGVANIAHYLEKLVHRPAFVTAAEEGAGFVELAQCLMKAQPAMPSPL